MESRERRKVVVSELVDPLGLGQILQPVVTEVAQPTGPDELGGRGRDQHLPAVTAGGDPRGPVDVHPDVALLGHPRGAGVDPHPHLIGPVASPSSVAVAARNAPSAVGKATKNESPCVSTSTPLVRAERLPHDAAMDRERFRVPILAQLVQQLRRALHVGEEEVTSPVGRSRGTGS